MDNANSNNEGSGLTREELLKLRSEYNQMELEASGRFDRGILALSSGTLVLSAHYIKDISLEPMKISYLLYLSWIFLIITIIVQMISHLFSQIVIRKRRDGIDKELAGEYDDSENNTQLGSVISKLNVSSLITFILGICMFCLFAVRNLI